MVVFDKNDGSALSSVPGTHREALGSAMSRFDSLLAAPDLFILPSTRSTKNTFDLRDDTHNFFNARTTKTKDKKK